MNRSLSPGLVVDLRVGESITLNPNDEATRVVVTIEAKSGQRVRARVQSPHGVPVETPKKLGAST
jgi:hypothetical protein